MTPMTSRQVALFAAANAVVTEEGGGDATGAMIRAANRFLSWLDLDGAPTTDTAVPPPPWDSDDDEAPADHQEMAAVLADAFSAHDITTLAGLTPAGRAEQRRVRWALFYYVDAMWDAAKERGLNPAVLREWSVVAGLRDLTMAFAAGADEARDTAGDEDHDAEVHPRVRFMPS